MHAGGQRVGWVMQPNSCCQLPLLPLPSLLPPLRSRPVPQRLPLRLQLRKPVDGSMRG